MKLYYNTGNLKNRRLLKYLEKALKWRLKLIFASIEPRNSKFREVASRQKAGVAHYFRDVGVAGSNIG